MKKGKIILLNGASFSGKSSIQKSLVKIWDKELLIGGIDNLFGSLIFPQLFEPSFSKKNL